MENAINSELPRLIIGVGCQKAGTSSISNFLKANGVVYPGKKELHAFTFFGKPTYLDRHKYLKKLRVASHQKTYGEYTPDYLIEPISTWNLSQIVPDAKIIVSIRNPVDRAFSSYTHGVGAGKIDREKSFKQSIESALAGASNWWENSLLFEGLYFNPIKRLFDIFPKDNIMIANYDDWTIPPNTEVFESELLEFCGLERISFQGIPHVNERQRWESKNRAVSDSLEQDLRVKLQDYFDASKNSLEEFLATDLQWWGGSKN